MFNKNRCKLRFCFVYRIHKNINCIFTTLLFTVPISFLFVQFFNLHKQTNQSSHVGLNEKKPLNSEDSQSGNYDKRQA